jgi:hypothetical protein
VATTNLRSLRRSLAWSSEPLVKLHGVEAVLVFVLVALVLAIAWLVLGW